MVMSKVIFITFNETWILHQFSLCLSVLHAIEHVCATRKQVRFELIPRVESEQFVYDVFSALSLYLLFVISKQGY